MHVTSNLLPVGYSNLIDRMRYLVHEVYKLTYFILKSSKLLQKMCQLVSLPSTIVTESMDNGLHWLQKNTKQITKNKVVDLKAVRVSNSTNSE